MSEFLEALIQYQFLRYAFFCGLLASLASGIVGTYVVTRRISYLVGAIAHFVLGGMGLARYLQVVYGWPVDPRYGALFAAVLAACLLSAIRWWGNQREDTLIGVIWSMGMAVGILFISQTPGYNEDLMSYLFGNILMVAQADLYFVLVLDVIILGFTFIFYNQLEGLCFDEEFTQLRGVPVKSLYTALLIITALTVVLLVQVVGIILVIALLTIPAGSASHFTRTLLQTIVVAIFLSILFVSAGLFVSFSYNFPAGATIILIAGFFYLAMSGIAKLRTN